MARVLVIFAPGLDWADLEARDRSEKIPHLARLRESGSAFWLTGAAPTSGPANAASIVTGVHPEAHGVWRDEEAWPGGFRPTGCRAWAVPPVWSRLEAAGVSTGSVAWPATRPGSNWPGLHLDDSFLQPSGRDHASWALPLDCTPARHREALRDRRVHPSTISEAMLAPLLAGVDEGASHAMAAKLRLALARAATVQSAAAWMLGESGAAPAAIFIHQPVVRDVARAFGDGEPEARMGAAGPALSLLDSLIGRLKELCEPDRTLVVVSSGLSGGVGVALAAGPGATPRRAGAGVSILDIAPAVLTLFGLVDARLAGDPSTLCVGPSRSKPAPDVSPPAPPSGSADLVEPLRRLVYRSPPAPSPRWIAEGRAELAAMVLPRNPSIALKIAERAIALDPDNVAALLVIARAHVALNQAEPLEAIGDRLADLAPHRGWEAAVRAARLVLLGRLDEARPHLARAEAETDLDTLIATATFYVALNRIAEATRVFRKILTLDPRNVTAEIGLAIAAASRRDFLNAEAGLHRAAAREPGRPAIWLQLANVYALSGRRAEASRTADRAASLGAAPEHVAAAASGRLSV